MIMQIPHHITILIVDDVALNIKVLAEPLKDDYRVQIATSGKKALEIANSENKPDIILLDIMMPEMDGYEVCKQLKSHPNTADIPVIFITAMDDSHNEELGFSLGAVDYITKPFNVSIVKARIKTHLTLKQRTDQLQKLTSTDPLTSIPNRRGFEQHLKQEFRRAVRHTLPVTMMMIDIDYFKLFNDHYGHGAGDDCLRRVSQAMSKKLNRATDMIARVGGEEFAVVLPDTNGTTAKNIAEILRQSVMDLKIEHAESTAADVVTISLGCVTMQPSTDDAIEDMIKLADERLYQAKEQGRNKVICQQL